MEIDDELRDRIFNAMKAVTDIPIIKDGKCLVNVDGEVFHVTVVSGRITEFVKDLETMEDVCRDNYPQDKK